MALDWGQIEDQYNSGDFKDYAKPGIYTVKCDGVEVKQVGTNGNFVMKFHFAETDDLQFPTADHFISKNKQNWRAYHSRMLFEVLGASEDRAKKGCEMAEEKDSYDYAVQIYEKGFQTLLKKQPEVEIEVYQDGKYTRAEFTDRRVAMPHGDEDKSSSSDDVLAESEEIILDTDLPF